MLQFIWSRCWYKQFQLVWKPTASFAHKAMLLTLFLKNDSFSLFEMYFLFYKKCTKISVRNSKYYRFQMTKNCFVLKSSVFKHVPEIWTLLFGFLRQNNVTPLSLCKLFGPIKLFSKGLGLILIISSRIEPNLAIRFILALTHFFFWL